MRRVHRLRREGGFTLIELTISAALLAMVLASAYLCLNAGFASQRMLDPRLEATQSARVALAMMTADLRCACALTRNAEFIGMKRTLGDVEAGNLDFATHNYTPSRQGDGDYCQTSYFLDRDKETGVLVLYRRRNPRIGLDPYSGGSREEIARGVRQLKLEFYDGFDWYDTWGDPDGRASSRGSTRLEPNLSGMPEAVRITLALSADPKAGRKPSVAEDLPVAEPSTETAGTGTAKSEEPPLIFQTVARLNLSRTGSGPSTGSSTGSEGGETQSTPAFPGGIPGGPQ